MKTTSLLLGVVVLVLVLSILCVRFLPSTQDFMVHNDIWNGVKTFCDEFGAVTVDSLDDLPDSSENTVLILIPYIELGSEELSAVAQFLDGRGTLLLMDDYGYGNQVLSYLEMDTRFSNRPLLDPLFNFKNLRLPRVTDFSPEVSEAGISTIVLNHATILTDTVESSVVARSSVSSFLDIDESGSREEEEPLGPFPVAARFQVRNGEVIVVADPSIVINSIIGRDDNYTFVRYLTSHNGQQQGILFTASHLPMASLDVSKTGLTKLQPILASPAGLLITISLVFITVSRFTFKKGGTIGQY
ncbi:MAG TPA: DUF4350 domain-containing protein [Dehalococcoidia bacterium]|nr:DUF4350 domain-containing protein [Dehalococcoidia bacterium]